MKESRFVLDRSSTLRLQRDLDWFFANRKPLRVPKGALATRSVVQGAWTVRPVELPPKGGATGRSILILILTPKRFVRRSVDRHKLQRWVREAVRQSAELVEIESFLADQGKQALLLFRVSANPSAEVNWESISVEVGQLAKSFSKMILMSSAAPVPTLITKFISEKY